MFRYLLLKDDHVKLCDRGLTSLESILSGVICSYNHRTSDGRRCRHITNSGVAFISSSDKIQAHAGAHMTLCQHCGSNSNADWVNHVTTLHINGGKWAILSWTNRNLPCTWKFIRHE